MNSDGVYTNYNLNDDIDITNINYNETPYCITLNIIDNNYVDYMKLFQFFINGECNARILCAIIKIIKNIIVLDTYKAFKLLDLISTDIELLTYIVCNVDDVKYFTDYELLFERHSSLVYNRSLLDVEKVYVKYPTHVIKFKDCYVINIDYFYFKTKNCEKYKQLIRFIYDNTIKDKPGYIDFEKKSMYSDYMFIKENYLSKYIPGKDYNVKKKVLFNALKEYTMRGWDLTDKELLHHIMYTYILMSITWYHPYLLYYSNFDVYKTREFVSSLDMDIELSEFIVNTIIDKLKYYNNTSIIKFLKRYDVTSYWVRDGRMLSYAMNDNEKLIVKFPIIHKTRIQKKNASCMFSIAEIEIYELLLKNNMPVESIFKLIEQVTNE